MRRFTERDITELLAPEAAVASLGAAFSRDWQSSVTMPNRMHLDLPEGGSFLVMPCSDRELPAVGIKVVSVRSAVPPGEPRVQAVFLLHHPATGELLALLEANHLTAVRTAAVSAVATRALAREDARVLSIFGTGVQAWSHLALLPRVRSFTRILVCGSSPARSAQFAQRAGALFGLQVSPANADECARQSDVLCTCTTSTVPLFDGRLVRPGTHLNLVGAFRPDAREVDEHAIGRARLVVETRGGALAEAGDLIIPLNMGLISRDDVCDLHEVLAGKKAGRTRREEITVFKSVGCAYEDLVTAKLIYDTALEREPAAR
jgi:alanine dehydrogenase